MEELKKNDKSYVVIVIMHTKTYRFLFYLRDGSSTSLRPLRVTTYLFSVLFQ